MKARIAPSIILSVGMIVKNEEKYLDACLTALKPLLRAVRSELVIVDTGSTDKTAEIAKRHTDKVYHFKWIDDFSAARNFGLDKCVGEWFMFLDADEILDSDLSDIIGFFTGKQTLNKYQSASIDIKSYYNPDCSEWSVFPSYRIVRRLPGLCFVNSVHETFSKIPPPTYTLNTIAHHYGYSYENEEEKEKKLARNLPLLYRELEKNPDDLRIYLHIYSSVGYEERIKLLPTMLEKARTQAEDTKKRDILLEAAAIYVQAVEFYFEKTRETEKAEKYIDEYALLFKTRNVLLLELTVCKGLVYLRKGDKSRAAEAFGEYFELYKSYTDKTLDRSGIEIFSLTFINEAPYRQIKDIYNKITQS